MASVEGIREEEENRSIKRLKMKLVEGVSTIIEAENPIMYVDGLVTIF